MTADHNTPDIMPRDEVQKLLDRMTFEVVNGELDKALAEEIGRSLLAAHDEIERLQTDVRTYQDIVQDMTAQVEALTGALSVCDRVLHFDLKKMIVFGDDYNQAVKDAADATRAALEAAEIATWPPEMQKTFRSVMGQRDAMKDIAEGQIAARHAGEG